MFTNEYDLQRYFSRFPSLTNEGRDLILEARNGPVRDVQGGPYNVLALFPSTKMQRQLRTESTLELSGLRDDEYNPSVYEIWTQPIRVMVEPQRKESGRRQKVPYVPDSLVLTKRGPVIKEFKPIRRLERLSEQQPNRYVLDEDGIWHDRAAETVFQPMGIEMTIYTEADMPVIFLQNMRLLERLLPTTDGTRQFPPPSDDVRTRIREVLDEHPKIEYLALRDEFGFDVEHVQYFMLTGHVYFPLRREPILPSNVAELFVYRDETAWKTDDLAREASKTVIRPRGIVEKKVGAKFFLEGVEFTIAILSAEGLVARAEHGGSMSLDRDQWEEFLRKGLIVGPGAVKAPALELSTVLANEAINNEAVTRLRILKGKEVSTVSKRTKQRWKRALKNSAGQQLGHELAALSPRKGGNRNAKALDPRTYELAREIIKERHNNRTAQSLHQSYLDYKDACAEKGIHPLSRKGFYDFVNREDLVDIGSRKGRRVAEKHRVLDVPEWYHFNEETCYGHYPGHCLYIDFTIPNLMTQGFEIPNLGKVTFGTAFDGFLRHVSAFHFTYRGEGAEAVLMLLRDYAWRHNRLPEIIVLDNGPAFHSRELEFFCDLYSIEIVWRRKARPQDSTLVERAFGCIEQEFFHNLRGNTKIYKNARESTKEMAPEQDIEWTVPALYEALDHYINKWAWNKYHAKMQCSPREKYQRAIADFGASDHRYVAYDRELKLLTAPHPKGGRTRTIQHKHGVFVHGEYYKNPILAKQKDRTVEVRIEPFNHRIIYVRLNNGDWVIAAAQDNRRLAGRSAWEYEQRRSQIIQEEKLRGNAMADADHESPDMRRVRNLLLKAEHWSKVARERFLMTFTALFARDQAFADAAANDPACFHLHPFDVGPGVADDFDAMRDSTTSKQRHDGDWDEASRSQTKSSADDFEFETEEF